MMDHSEIIQIMQNAFAHRDNEIRSLKEIFLSQQNSIIMLNEEVAKLKRLITNRNASEKTEVLFGESEEPETKQQQRRTIGTGSRQKIWGK